MNEHQFNVEFNDRGANHWDVMLKVSLRKPLVSSWCSLVLPW